MAGTALLQPHAQFSWQGHTFANRGALWYVLPTKKERKIDVEGKKINKGTDAEGKKRKTKHMSEPGRRA